MAGADPRPVLVYDGRCGFCSSSARLARRLAPPAAVRIEPWQRLDLDALGLTREQADESVRWVHPGVRRSAGALAFAHFLQTAPRPWRWLGRLLALPAVQVVARPTYSWVSRNRYRLPAGAPTCGPDERG
jgi:predicted DCC family thiol-disulfide oxidoreductase YuxK